MTAAFSQQFTGDPGAEVVWVFGFTLAVRRAGIAVEAEQGSFYRYRGYLGTTVTMQGSEFQIFPFASLGPIWFPRSCIVLPDPLNMGLLFLRVSKRNPAPISFRFFVSDTLN